MTASHLETLGELTRDSTGGRSEFCCNKLTRERLMGTEWIKMCANLYNYAPLDLLKLFECYVTFKRKEKSCHVGIFAEHVTMF